MTDILENTTSPLAETAVPAPAEVATSELAPSAQGDASQPSTVEAQPTAPNEATAPSSPAPISADVAAVEHKAEQDTHHALSHLEAEAVALFVTLPENEVKALLAWVAGKL